MKKRIYIFCLIFLMVLVLINCGKRKKNGVAVRVAYWGSPEEIKIITDTVRNWEKEHPNISVKLQHTSGGTAYISKILTQIAGGDAPDIVFAEVNVFVPMFEKGVFLDLTPFIKKDKDFNIDDFFQPVVRRFTRNGKT